MQTLRKKLVGILSLVMCMALVLQPVQSYAIDENTTEADASLYQVILSVKGEGKVEADDTRKVSETETERVYEYSVGEKVSFKVQPDAETEVKVEAKNEDAAEVQLEEKDNEYTFVMPENTVKVEIVYTEVKTDNEEAEKIPDDTNSDTGESTDNNEEETENETPPSAEKEENTDDQEIPEDKKQEEEKTTEQSESEVETEEEAEIQTEQNPLKDIQEENNRLLSPDQVFNQKVPSLLRATPRATTINYLGKVSYAGTTVGHFEVNGSIAFCLEHQKTTPPSGTSFAESIYNNPTIRKVLYYGWKGPEQWSGFGSEAQGIVCTSLVLSYYYSGPDSIITLGGPTDKKIGVTAFMDYIKSKPAVGDPDVSLSKTYTESSLSDDKTYQRTDSIQFKADAQNTITLPLPKGVTLVNETTGATGTGNVKIKGGDRFYLKAPLSMNGTWSSGKLYGSMGKFQSVLLTTASSGMQNLGQGRWATDPNAHVELSVKWVQMGDIRLVKFLESDDEIKTPAVGAEFTLTHKETGEKVVITADKDGVATTEDKSKYPTGRLVGGVWKVEETKTPEGFKTIDPFEVTISGQGQVFSYIVEDKEIHAALQVVKLDESTGNTITASGATFKIVDEEGNDVEFTSYSPSKETYTEFTTDENGQFTLPNVLKYGSYKLVEVQAPEGYLLCDPIEFKVDQFADFEKPLVVKAEDKNVMGKIRLRKTDVETAEAVAGAEYHIYAKEDIVTGDGTVRVSAGTDVGTLVTDSSGEAVSEDLYLGSYIIKEEKAPDGFVLDQEEHEVNLVYEDQETEVVIQNVDVTDKPVKIKVYKLVKDKEDVLEGVKFQVWNTDMASDIDPNMVLKETYTTDETGSFEVKYLSPGNYAIQEVQTKDGYVLDDTIINFSVDEAGTVKTEANTDEEGSILVENDYTKLHISKQEATTGKELPGAKLQIKDKDGKVIEEWTSGEEPHVIEAIKPGDYILHEDLAPVGYNVSQDINFTVKETGEVQTVVMKDELKEGTIKTSTPNNFREGKSTSGGVKTGDNANIWPLLITGICSLIVVFGLLIRESKKERKEHEEE